MHTIIDEGSANLKVPKAEKISKNMDVFYNPVMGLNRDISVLLLNSINKSNMQIADPLAATGVRSIRFLKELNKNKIKMICINDSNKGAVRLIKENLALNKVKYENNQKIVIANQDANLLLLNSTGFDYIDLDPWGTPNSFLDSACRRLARDGILAVTATDTSALAGTSGEKTFTFAHESDGSVDVTKILPATSFWKAEEEHQTGLRILIRKAQLIAAQYDKALVPAFSYSKEHYMRVFLRNNKGKGKVDKVLKQHGYFNDAGPLWLGNLWDKKLCNIMYKNALNNSLFYKNKEIIKFLRTLKEESKINTIGFYDLHDICEKNKIRHLQKKEIIIDKIKRLGYKASKTHFKGEGIRSYMPHSEIIKLLKNK